MKTSHSSDPYNNHNNRNRSRAIAAVGLSAAAALGVMATLESQPKSHDTAGISASPQPNPGSVAPTAPAVAETTPATTPDYAAQFAQERAKAQANLTAVSAAQLKDYISLVEREGYNDPQLPNVKRHVVRGTNGISYTAELDFTKPVSTTSFSANPLEAITIYIDKPGDAFAKQVVIDGWDGLSADHSPIDGKIDSPLGYNNITEAEISQAVDKYGQYSEDFLDIQALNEAGVQAQQDYQTAIDQILSPNSTTLK